MESRILLTAVATALLAAPSFAQFQGNGIGQSFLQHTMLRIGATVDVQLGSPLAPGGVAVLAVSDGITPTANPFTGVAGLDLLSPALLLFVFPLDAAGNGGLSAAVAAQPSLALAPPLFGMAAVFEPGQISTTRTSRLQFENADGFTPSGSLRIPRAGHTATPLGRGPRDNESRILVVGGGGGTLLVPQATQSSELYSSLTRAPIPGPSLAFPRALHQAVRLPNGNVLVCGGTDSGGNVTATVEIYDPATNLFTMATPMRAPRTGHQATVLQSGRVLVTGGLATYVNPLANLAAVLNTAQDTGEIFDPVAGTWSFVPGAMSSRRSGHVHTPLPDGRILISGGIQGGVTTAQLVQLPTYTATCNIYDPATNSFVATGSLGLARAFHGTSVLGNGSVLVTGGTVLNAAFSIVGATDSCEVWNGATFAPSGLLSTPATNHAQFAAPNGDAVVLGGLTGIFPVLGGSAVCGRHNGVVFTATAALGTNPGNPAAVAAPRGAMTASQLVDGSWLLLGGTDGAAPLASAFVYLP